MVFTRPGRYKLLGWTCVILVIVLSLLPGRSMPHFRWQDLIALDKLGHFTLYGLAAWGFMKDQTTRRTHPKTLPIIFLLFLLGLILEVLQYSLHQGRQFDGFDLLANVLGVTAARFAVGIPLKAG